MNDTPRDCKTLLGQFSEHIGEAFRGRVGIGANAKAAYRFFSNSRIGEEQILRGHFHATGERIRACDALILMLHGTAESTSCRNDVAPVGILHKFLYAQRQKGPTAALHRLRHSDALQLGGDECRAAAGLAAIEFWTRDEFKGCNALKKRINPPRVPIERKESYRWLENVRQSTAPFSYPERCVYIGDRESDICELFCATREAGTHFQLRTCVDRLAGDGNQTISAVMEHAPLEGLHRLALRGGARNSLSSCARAAADWQAEKVSAVTPHGYLCPGTRPPARARAAISLGLTIHLPATKSCGEV